MYPRNLTSNKPPLGQKLWELLLEIHTDNAAANAYGYVELEDPADDPSDSGFPIPPLSNPKVPDNQNVPSEELPLPLKTPPPNNETTPPNQQTPPLNKNPQEVQATPVEQPSTSVPVPGSKAVDKPCNRHPPAKAGAPSC